MKNKRELLKYRGEVCLNCGQALDKSEKYCHNCGQLNNTKPLNFNDFFYEYFSGTLAYDSKTLQSLKFLLFRPGKVPKDYIEGKRVRYVNPYKFYLSVSIIFFIVWGFNMNITDPNNSLPPETEMQTDILERTIFSENKEKTLNDIYVPATAIDSLSIWSAFKTKSAIFFKYYKKNKNTIPEAALADLNYPPNFYNLWLYGKVGDLYILKSDPGLFLKYFLGKLPVFIFFYLPLFGLFIWLLYVRHPYTYLEHLIFTFFEQAIWFLLYTLGLILNYIFSTGTLTEYMNCLFLIHLLFALKTFYGQNWVKTVIKFTLLNIIFITLALIAAIFSVLASFAFY